MTHSLTLPTGVRLEYVERGAPDGAPVIFLHGVTDSWRSFEGVLRLLPPYLRAFAVTTRGHGESSRPADGYRFEAVWPESAARLLSFRCSASGTFRIWTILDM
jgi:pimeloyl-ACP methyl ester carboxylesterase